MAEEVDKKLLDRLAHIEIAIKSINPDPEQTAPSLGLDAAAISRHQTVNVLASSGVSATWYESPPTNDGPRSAVSSASRMLEGRADPEAPSSLLRSRINRIARNVSGTALPDGITTEGWTSTTPRSRPIAGRRAGRAAGSRSDYRVGVQPRADTTPTCGPCATADEAGGDVTTIASLPLKRLE